MISWSEQAAVASLKWSTTRPGGGQAFYWSDAALTAAYPEGGKDATLDFYNVHYCAPLPSPHTSHSHAPSPTL